MSSSTLDLDGDEKPVTDLGHGTNALGPSDSSDSGSDVMGGPGMDEGLSDDQARRMPMTTTQGAGRDFGDPDVRSDSDRSGTGERASSGLDSEPVDQQLTIRSGLASDGLDDVDDAEPTDDEIANADRLPESDGAIDADADADADAAADEETVNEGEASVDDGAT